MEANTIFVIAITTAKMLMPGMPAMENIPGMPDLSAPTRTLTMDLTSPKKADAKSKAECAVPEGLKIGPKAVLDIDLPGKAVDQPDTPGGSNDPGKMPDFKMKYYWKSSQTVLPGQPKIIDSKSMNAEMKRAMEKDPAMKSAFQRATNADEGSHAYWPGRNAKELVKGSTCPGNYVLTTNYCGGTAITLDSPQDFLAPIDLTSPGKKVDLAEYIKVDWKAVPNAAAYIVNAFGGKEGLMVMWTSASEPDPSLDVLSKAVTKEQLAKYLKNGTLLAPDKTSVYIPAGIFKEVGNAMLTVTAIGVDKIQSRDGIETQVVVRSNATTMLGASMMGMEGMEEENGEDLEGLDESDAPPAAPVAPKVKGAPKTQPEEDEEAAVEGDDSSVEDSANALDKTDETLDKANDKKDKVGDVINKAKKLFKRR